MAYNHSAVITGSTSGIGKGIAKVLAKNGYNIMLNGFGDADEIERLRCDIEKKYNVKAAYDQADMTKPGEIKKLIDDTNTTFGSVDVLVNNAGVQYVAKTEEFPNKEWDKILAINLSAAFHSSKAALPYMKKQKSGRIINIASAHGLVASANKSAYVAAKHGLVGLTKVIALETAETGITCNAICPGWVLTPLVEEQIKKIAHQKNIGINEAELELLSEKQPSKQFVKTDQIGDMVVFLCKPDSSAITGSALSIDGGWTSQ